MATNQVLSHHPRIPEVPTLLLALALPLVQPHSQPDHSCSFRSLCLFWELNFLPDHAQGSQQGDEHRGRKAGLPFLPTGHAGGFTASKKLPSGKCKNHTVTGGNVHLDSFQLPLFCFNHNHSFMWAVHCPPGEGIASLNCWTSPGPQISQEQNTQQERGRFCNPQSSAPAGGEEGKPLTNRPKNKCKGFLALFSGPLYSPYEGKRTVGFKLHFSLLLKFRSQENIWQDSETKAGLGCDLHFCCPWGLWKRKEITQHYQHLFKLLGTSLGIQIPYP